MLDNRSSRSPSCRLPPTRRSRARGECPFVAVPVALSKIFRHSCIYVRTGAGIKTPQDLKGKRVGTSQWSSTGLVFMRGMLQHDYGVKAAGHALVHGRAQQLRRAAADPARPAQGHQARLSLRPARRSERMFAAGELDALLSLYIPKLFLERLAARSRACFRTTRRSSRTTTAAPEFFRSCTPWCCARMSIARIRGRRAASTGRSCEARDLAVDGLYDTDALRRRAAVADRPRRGGAARVRQGFLGLWSRAEPADLRGRSAATSTSRACRPRVVSADGLFPGAGRGVIHADPQQSPRRPEPHRYGQDRPQGAFLRCRDARHDRRPSTCRARPTRSRSRSTAAPPTPRSMATAFFAKQHQSGPPHRGDRPAVEVAHARDRPRRRSTRRTA